jgi:hypothetical protein
VVALIVVLGIIIALGISKAIADRNANNAGQGGTDVTTPPSSAPAPAAFSCTNISTDLQTVLSDLESSDAAEQEAWVTGGNSADLQQLINDTDGVTGSAQLDDDAVAFNADASGYLSDQSPSLNTGWQTEYHQVRVDINALATDCAMSPVPAPPGAV